MKKYKQYKSTDIEWLGEIPEHWMLISCRAIVCNLKGKNEGAKNQDYLSLMANVGVIPYAEKGDVGNKKPEDLSKCKLVKKGNLLINSMNYSIGSYGMSNYDGVCSPVYIVLEINERLALPLFAFRLFENKAFQKYLASLGNGILEHRAAIGWEDIKGKYVPMPPINEQAAVLIFLQEEAVKIDALIREQKRLIQLLKEKRQAVISHAVTKGLDPKVPMKDSGVEWLGMVPGHWKICSLKRVFSSVDYGISDMLQSEGAIAILRMGNIQDGKVIMEDLKYTQTIPDELLLENGDLLYNRTNSLELIGKVGLFNEKNTLPTSFASYLVRLRTVTDSDSRYFAYFLNTEGILGEARSNALVAIGQCNLNPTRYGQIQVAIPSKVEQMEIVNFLDDATQKIDELMNSVHQAVSLLQERRSALISAAVTGKIDVRDFIGQEAS